MEFVCVSSFLGRFGCLKVTTSVFDAYELDSRQCRGVLFKHAWPQLLRLKPDINHIIWILPL